MVARKKNFAWERMFNSNSTMIEHMFSKIQNCTSLGSVGFLRERQGNFSHKNMHLLHASAGDREIFWDGEHRPDCADSIPYGTLDFEKMGNKSYEGKIFMDAPVN